MKRLLDWLPALVLFPALFLLWGMIMQSLISISSWFWILGLIMYLLLIILYQNELNALHENGENNEK